MADDRRHFQRLNLTKAVEGLFGETPVAVIEVSANGALMLVDGTSLTLGTRALLRFTWRGEELKVLGQVVRSEPGRAALTLIGDSHKLQQMIGDSVIELLRAQEANATGDRERNIVGGDETLTAASSIHPDSTYMMYRLTPSGWKRRRALLPDQPPDGFTIAANVPEEDVDLLCRTYESGDVEARRLTRLMAELSVAARRGRR